MPAELPSLQARRMRQLLKLVALDRILAKRKASYTVLAAQRHEPGRLGSWVHGHRAVQGWPQPAVDTQQPAQHAVDRHGTFLQHDQQLSSHPVPDRIGTLAVSSPATPVLGHQTGRDQLAGRQATHPLCRMQQGARLGQQSPAQQQICPQEAAHPQQAPVGELPPQQGPVQLPQHQPTADAVTAQPAGVEPAEQGGTSGSNLPESYIMSMHIQPQTSPMQHQLPGRLPPLRLSGLSRQGRLSQIDGVPQAAASTSQDAHPQQAIPGERAPGLRVLNNWTSQAFAVSSGQCRLTPVSTWPALSRCSYKTSPPLVHVVMLPACLTTCSHGISAKS